MSKRKERLRKQLNETRPAWIHVDDVRRMWTRVERWLRAHPGEAPPAHIADKVELAKQLVTEQKAA